MTSFIVIAAALGLIALPGGVVLFVYLCAMAQGRVPASLFQVELDYPAGELDELPSPSTSQKSMHS